MGSQECGCAVVEHPARLVVLTGGPGGGKTAVLELVRRTFCEHVGVLPEAASIVFGGGFPRRAGPPAAKAAQRAISHVQRQLEWLAQEERRVAVALCDRGTLDGLAYWPGDPAEWFAELGTSQEQELARYAAVIHLRTPALGAGYSRDNNPVRTESAEEAAALDARIEAGWRAHPRRFVVDNAPDFLEKARQALALIRAELPECCRGHRVPGVDRDSSH
jgi:predicted ATPase